MIKNNIINRTILFDNTFPLTFIFKSLKKEKSNNLKSQLEISLSELISSIKKNKNNSHVICEGGWYFNKLDKVQKEINNLQLYYFILSPSIMKLRENYLSRTPKSKKKLNQNEDWVNYENKIWIPLLNQIRKLEKSCNKENIPYFKFTNESLIFKKNKIIKIISSQKNPTLFIITGPNASGKSTTFKYLMDK